MFRKLYSACAAIYASVMHQPLTEMANLSRNEIARYGYPQSQKVNQRKARKRARQLQTRV